MSEKSFDINSKTSGHPIKAALDDSELAGASRDTRRDDETPEEAETIFPLSFDRDNDKDFRPQEIAGVGVPKGSFAPGSVEAGRSSLTSPTGLEDVSLEDQETIAQPSAEKDS